MSRILKLTKTVVDTLQPADREYEICDEKLSGFRVRVFPSGYKSYAVVFRTGRGRRWAQKRETIGEVNKITCEQARRRAQEIISLARLGKSLVATDKGHTCDELFDEFLRLHVRVSLKPRTVAEYERIIAKHLRPFFRGRPVQDIGLCDVQALHSGLKATPRLANLTISVLGKAMTLAERWGWRDGLRHPCKGISRFPERSRNRLLTPSEIQAIRNELSSGNHHPTVVLAINLLMATGCRSDEICRLKWSYVEWEKQQISWPDTKTGSLEKPMSTLLRSILQNAPLICPLLSGPISILELVTKEEWNGEEAQAGRDHRQAA